jgi:hypothetical protein
MAVALRRGIGWGQGRMLRQTADFCQGAGEAGDKCDLRETGAGKRATRRPRLFVKGDFAWVPEDCRAMSEHRREAEVTATRIEVSK